LVRAVASDGSAGLLTWAGHGRREVAPPRLRARTLPRLAGPLLRFPTSRNPGRTTCTGPGTSSCAT